MIYIKDQSLSDQEIDKILVFATHPQDTWDQTFTFTIDKNNEIVKKIRDQINNDLSSKGLNEKFEEVEFTQLATYPQGSSKMFHFDSARESSTGTSITFLNDDLVGGQAIVEGVEITPIKGRTYYFDGKMYKHGVNNVIKGVRYTLSTWYTNEKLKHLNEHRFSNGQRPDGRG